MFAFIIFGAWVVLWRPTVTIGESGIAVVNPLRTYRIAWPTLLSTEGRYFLTLVTADRKISVWAAPRQRRGVTGIDVRRDSFGLPDYAAEQQFERQSAATSVGEVAEQLIARRRPEPVLDTLNTTGGDSVETRFHVVSFVVLIVLLAATGAAFVVR
jgi:hypothetical protein